MTVSCDSLESESEVRGKLRDGDGSIEDDGIGYPRFGQRYC